MNKITGVIIAILLIAGAYFVVHKNPNQIMNNNLGTEANATKGRVIFSVTDAAANMGNVSEVNLQLGTLEMHNVTNGWVTVSATPKAFNLLDLNAKKKNELWSDSNINAGTYDKIRFELKSVAVITKNNGTKIATIPAGGMELATRIVVKNGETSVLNLDFMAAKSLQTNAKGEYIFAPVVKTESKSSATVSFGQNNAVMVTSGTVEASNTYGMEANGSLKLK